jgi:PAS domain S-box-containing protein
MNEMSAYNKLTKAELIETIKTLEAQLRARAASSSEHADRERERLLHDLQVHQIELETQNEELRRTQQLLEESRDRYADLYDFAPVGYLTINARQVIQEINLTGAALLGSERARLIGTPLNRHVVRDDVPTLRAYLRQCREQKEGTTTELHLHVAGRSPIVVQLVSVVVQDAKTSQLDIRMTMQDITERKQAEALAQHVEELEFLSASATHLLEPRPSGELFRYTAQQVQRVAGEALVVVNEYDPRTQQTVVRAWGGPANKMHQLSALLGRDPLGLALTVAEGTRGRMVRGSLTRVEGGLYNLTFHQLPLPLCQQIEQKLELGDVYAMPFVLGDDLMGAVAILTDRTEGLRNRGVVEVLVNQVGLALRRTRVEEHERELNQDLEHRTTELEATNAELEAFVYSVSHDLRTPLHQIEQFARLMLEEFQLQLPADSLRYLRLVNDNAVAANRLAEDLLALSRTHRQVIKKQTVAMRELVEQVLLELPNEPSGRRVEITVGDLPPAQADPLLLKQVWVNLLANALKFTGPREVATIEIGAFEKDGKTVYFVKDNGTGFDMAYSDRLFRAFQRLHPEDQFPGNGLGLAIVERIIRHHGGRVWARAEVDHGATFYFSL